MPINSIRCVFMRGGTSKALIFRRDDLPSDQAQWDSIFLAAMGSPDPNGRQLDGMGGGISSLSKVCVVGRTSHPEADVDYTFAQIGTNTATVDYGGNCGNMSSAIGPFAVDEGMVCEQADGIATVRIHNTNTGKIIIAQFPVSGGKAAVHGEQVIDGVAGSGAPIRLEFRQVAGSRTGVLLPTGRSQDCLQLPSGKTVRVSLVDAANPCVFVAAEDLGLNGSESAEQLQSMPELMVIMENLRRQSSIKMGLATDLESAALSRSVPFIGIVAKPRAWRTQSGVDMQSCDADLSVRMLSSGSPHRAIPVTSALCVAVASRTPGSVAAQCVGVTDGPIRIGHSSGTIMVEAQMDYVRGEVLHASVYRTARRLFHGEVLYLKNVGEES